MMESALQHLQTFRDLALQWLLSPAAWSQFIFLALAFALAWLVRRAITPVALKILTPAEGRTDWLSATRRVLVSLLPLLLPVLAYAFTALGEQATRAAFGADAVIAFGKRLFLLIAAWIFVSRVLSDAFLKLLGRYVLLPVALLHLVGLLTPVIAYLAATQVTLGNISFSVLALVRGAVAGSLLFWLGRWSNTHSSTYIRGQQTLQPATRELAAKAAEVAIFGAALLLLMNIMGINLSTLAILGGAVGVGLGFGLQKIASNFISGIILLLEGQATVGDYVALDGGEEGTIVAMKARATILETFDGRWIVVPNEDFIITRVTNFSDAGSANRYEAAFSVSYETDINLVPGIVEPAVAALEDVLDTPYPPDCELRGFGESGIDFAVEFWVNGIDDGRHKYTSQALFAVWNALRDNGIEIPYPQRVVHLKRQDDSDG